MKRSSDGTSTQGSIKSFLVIVHVLKGHYKAA